MSRPRNLRWLKPDQSKSWWTRRFTPVSTPHASISDPQPHAAVKRVADRLRAGGAVEEQVGDPALGDAEAEPAAIFEPALVTDGGHDGAVAGDTGDDAGSRSEGLHPSAVDVGFDA